MNYKDKQKKIISPLVANSLPLSVRKDYDSSASSTTGRSIFSDFIQAYYEFVEREVNASINDFKNVSINTFKNKSLISLGPQSGGPYNILNRLPALRDFDTTMQSLRVHLRSEYLKNIPENIEGNLNNLMRMIREVYQSKGTEIAYKVLFRYIWNSNVKLTDTATEIFRPSDNHYKIEKAIRVKLIGGIDGTTQTNLNLFKDNYVVGKDSGAKVLVEDITLISPTVTELTIDEATLDGIFLPTEQVFAQTQDGTDVLNTGVTSTVRAQIVPGVGKVNITNRGMGYVPGDILTFHTSTGSGAIAKVRDVTDGPVELLVKGTAGSGYTAISGSERLSFSSMYIDIFSDIATGNLDNSFTLTLTGGSGEFTIGDTFINGENSSGTTATGIITSWNSSTKVLGVTNVHGNFLNNTPIIGANSGNRTLLSHVTAAGATGEWKDSDFYGYIQKNVIGSNEVNAGSFVTGTTYEISVVSNTDFTLVGALKNKVGEVFTATGAGSGNGKVKDPEHVIKTSPTLNSNGTIGTTKATAEVLVKAYPMSEVSEVTHGQAPNIWRLFIDEISGDVEVGDYCRIGDGATYSIGRIVNTHKYQSKPHGKYTISSNALNTTSLLDGGAGYKIAPQPYIHWDTLTGYSTTHASILSFGSKIGGVKEIDIIDPGIEYISTDTVTFPMKVIMNANQGTDITTLVLLYNGHGNGLADARASGTITPSAIVKKSSSFIDNIGFMDGTQRLADYNSYQPFSYLIETPVHPDTFTDLVSTVLHPAGMKMITKYVIESKQTPTLTAKQEIN